MLAVLLDRGHQAQRRRLVEAVERDHGGELRQAEGERPRLVQRDGAHCAEVFERLAALDGIPRRAAPPTADTPGEVGARPLMT